MTRDEFLALPPALGLKTLLTAISKAAPKVLEELRDMEAPKVPRAPKYDMRISRKGGYQWASETDLESLKFWRERFNSNAQEGGQYAERDGKKAQKLEYWVSWREACPDAIWSGQRNDDVVTAKAPTGKPQIHEWEERGQVPLRDNSNRGDAYEEEGGDDSFPSGW